jgi:hypothetical protein
MEDPLSMLNLVCAGFFILSTLIFFYYLYFLIKDYMRHKSDMKEDIPCPNTCNPGYECKQSDAVADFVIGEVVQEGVSEDEKPEDEKPVEEPAVEDLSGNAPELNVEG